MKTTSQRLAVAVSVLILSCAGCGKKETSSPTPPTSSAGATAPTPSPSPVTTAKDAVETVAAQTTSELSKVASNASQQASAAVKTATDAAAAARAQFDQMIETSKRLMGEKKYDDALKILNDLLKGNLSTTQQSLAANLKQQIEQLVKSAVADKAGQEATKSVEGLLKRK